VGVCKTGMEVGSRYCAICLEDALIGKHNTVK
jgi:hypothetical protein